MFVELWLQYRPLLLVVWMSLRPCDTSVNQAVPESETDSNPGSQLGKKTGEIGL